MIWNTNAQSKKKSIKLAKQDFITNFKYEVISDFNKEGAKNDIIKNKIRILFSGGFGGMPTFNSDNDLEFQKKYSVKFLSQGCIRMGKYENEKEYNSAIFAYLDKKFGQNWRYEIRDDAIGIK